MRILVAPDKFKYSLGATAVAEQIAAGLREILPAAEITLKPVADGGEGTASVICRANDGLWHACRVHDPLGRLVTARYCTIEAGATAIMEMSEASGLWRLAPNERDPLRASSLGTGEMLLDATRRGAREIIIGLGGSATNDGGFGLARALGFRFLDEQGCETSSLLALDRMIRPNELELPRLVAAVDVQSPLLGQGGATRIYGPQKGATPDQIERVESAMARFAEIVGGDASAAGGGAAGGLGFGLRNLCGAQIRSGFEVVAEKIELAAAIAEADVVVTGEGKLDAQTLEGKALAGVVRMARAARKPVCAIVGSASEKERAMFDAVFVLAQLPVSEAEAMSKAAELVKARAMELARWLQACA